MSIYARDVRHGLIFDHHGNARAASCVVLIGVVAALIGSVFMAIGPLSKQERRPAQDASVGETLKPIRIVGHTPPEIGRCDQYVWPNIDRRCLVRAETAANSGSTSSPVQDDKLSPLTARTDSQSSQEAMNGATPYQTTAPAAQMPTASDNNEEEAGVQEPVEQPRKRTHRHYRSFHFGTFRF